MNSEYFINIEDIDVPDFMYAPYKLDNDILGGMFSDLGGIIPSQVTLLTGVPGSGKTTLAGYIASLVSDFLMNHEPSDARPHGPVVLISREMSNFQVKLLSKKIANFGDIVLLNSNEHTKADKLYTWIQEIIKLEPSLIILDSLHQLAKEMKGPIGKNHDEIIGIFRTIAHELHTSIIIIGHVNKSGEFKGNNDIQHDIDTHIHLNFDKETNEREITLEKNRFGTIGKNAIMKFEAGGISIVADFLDGEQDDRPYEEVIREFHRYNANRKSLSQSSIQVTLTKLLEHLKNSYADKLENAGRPIGSVKIFFTQGKKSYADLANNAIYIGFDGIRAINADTSSVNAVENNYMKNLCKTREDIIIWMLLHDFSNLLYGNSTSDTFFQKVYNIAEENFDLFSTYNNAI